MPRPTSIVSVGAGGRVQFRMRCTRSLSLLLWCLVITLHCVCAWHPTEGVYFPFEGNSISQDGQITLTVLWGTPLWKPASECRFGQCLYLDGSTVLQADPFPSSVPTGGDAYTVAFFTKVHPFSHIQGGWVGYGTGGAVGLANNFRLHEDGRIHNYWYHEDLTVSNNVSDGKWHSIVGTWDGTNRRIYVDGVQAGADVPTPPNFGTTSFLVGRTLENVANITAWIDELYVAPGAFPAALVSAYHKHGLAAINSILMANATFLQPPDWSMQIGGTTHDSSWPRAVATDAAGNVLLGVATFGPLVPHQLATGGQDVAVFKFSGAGVEQWRVQFGSADVEYPSAVVADFMGDVVVVGDTKGSLVSGQPSAGNYDVFVVKLAASDGHELWRVQMGTSASDYVRALAVDDAGAVLFGGYTHGEFVTGQLNGGFADAFCIKLNSSGHEQWRYQTGTTEQEVITAMTVDGSGVLLFMTQGVSGVLVRLSRSGNELWRTSLYDLGPVGYISMAARGAEGVVVVFASGSHNSVAVLGLDNMGTLEWRYNLGVWPGTVATPGGITVDSAGHTTVSAFSPQSLIPGHIHTELWDCVVFQLNAAGEELWRYQGGPVASATGVASDYEGNIFVSGTTSTDPRADSWLTGEASAGGTDAFLMRLTNMSYYIAQMRVQRIEASVVDMRVSNEAVIEVWANVSVPVLVRAVQFCVRVVATSQGSLRRYFSPCLPNAVFRAPSNMDILTNISTWEPDVRYTFSITVADVELFPVQEVAVSVPANPMLPDWSMQIGTQYRDTGSAVVVDANGNVILAIQTELSLGAMVGRSANKDGQIIKFGSNGVEQWRHQFGSDDDEFIHAAAVDSTGDIIFVGGTSGTLVIDRPGDEMDAFVIKLAGGSGDEIWVSQLGTPAADRVISVVVTPDGTIFLAGDTTGQLVPGQQSGGGYDPFCIKMSSSGAEQWRYQSGTASNEYLLSLAVDPLIGNAYLTVYEAFPAILTTLVAVNRSGVEEWRVVVSSARAFCAVDRTGQVWLAYWSPSYTSTMVARLSSSGEVEFTFEILQTVAKDLFIDAFGSMFVLGETQDEVVPGVENVRIGESGEYSAPCILSKLDSGGRLLWAYQFPRGCTQVSADNHDNAYVAGSTESSIVPGFMNVGFNDATLFRLSSVEQLVNGATLHTFVATVYSATQVEVSAGVSIPSFRRRILLTAQLVATSQLGDLHRSQQLKVVARVDAGVTFSVGHNFTGLEPHTTYQIRLFLAGIDTGTFVQAKTRQNNVQLRVPQGVRLADGVVSGDRELNITVPIAVQGPAGTAGFQACIAWGFEPACTRLGYPPRGPDDMSIIEGVLVLPGLQLKRTGNDTFHIGKHIVEMTISSTDNATEFVPPLPWILNMSILVRGTVVISQPPDVLVSNLPPPSILVQLFPFPPPASIVSVLFQALPGSVSWSTNLNTSVSPELVLLTRLSPSREIPLLLNALGAITTARVSYSVTQSSANLALSSYIDVHRPVIEFAIHNSIECRVRGTLASNSSLLHLYAGQDSHGIPHVSLSCIPALQLPEGIQVYIKPRVSEQYQDLLQLPSASAQLRSYTHTVLEVAARALPQGIQSVTIPLQFSVSFNPISSSDVPLYPINVNNVQVHVSVVSPQGRVHPPSHLQQDLFGTQWQRSGLNISLSHLPHYNLTVRPVALNGSIEFDPPFFSFLRHDVRTGTLPPMAMFHLRGVPGAHPGSHAITYELSGPDQAGFSLSVLRTFVNIQGTIKLVPPLSILFVNAATGVSVSLSGTPAKDEGDLVIDFSGTQQLLMTPTSFSFSYATSTSQRIDRIRVAGDDATAPSSILLTPVLLGLSAGRYVVPSWNITVSRDVPVTLPSTCVETVGNFRGSTQQIQELYILVGLANVIERTVLIYGRDESWHVCNVDIAASPVASTLRGKPVYNVTCSVLPGVGAGYRVGVALAQRPETPLITCGSGNATFAYARPVLVSGSLRITSFDAVGQSALFGSSVGATDTVFMDGFNFGSNSSLVRVTYGPVGDPGRFACDLLQFPSPSSGTLGCQMEAGSGTDLVFRVTVDNQAVVSRDTYSYPNPPTITGLSSSSCGTDGCPTLGGALLTVEGRFFTPTAEAMQVTVGGEPCHIYNSSDTSITCMLPPGSGERQDVRVLRVFGSVWLSSAASNASDTALLSFAEPRIEELYSASCSRDGATNTTLSDCPRVGNTDLTVVGLHFGPQPNILVGGRLCLDVQRLPDTNGDSAQDDRVRVRCTLPPGVNVNQPVLVLTPEGSFSSASDRALVSYRQCPKGYRQLNTPGSNGTSFECQACSRYTFQTLTGQPECSTCPTNHYKSSPDTTRSLCTECPAVGASCFQGLPVVAKEGYWLHSLDNSTVKVVQCLSGYCLAATECFPDDQAMSASGLPAVSCCSPGRRPAHSNALCAHCLDGYSLWSNECVPCSGVNYPLVGLLLCAGLLLLIILHMSSRRTRGAKLNALIFFLQTIRACTKSDPSFPTVLSSLASLDLLGTSGRGSCLMPLDGLTLAVLPFAQLLLLYGILAAMLLLNTLSWCWSIRCCQSRRESQFDINPFVRVAFLLLTTSLIPTIQAALLMNICIRVNDELYVARAFPTEDCNSSLYNTVRISTASVSFAIVCVTSAVVLLWGRPRVLRFIELSNMLRSASGHTRTSSDAMGSRVGALDQQSTTTHTPADLGATQITPSSRARLRRELERLRGLTQDRFGFLFVPYRQNGYAVGWAAANIVRNICVVAVAVLAEEWRTRFALLGGVLSVFLAIQMFANPYVSTLDNALQLGAYVCLILISVLNATEWYAERSARVLSLLVYYGFILAWILLFLWYKNQSRHFGHAHVSVREWIHTLLQEAFCWHRRPRVPQLSREGPTARSVAQLPRSQVELSVEPPSMSMGTSSLPNRAKVPEDSSVDAFPVVEENQLYEPRLVDELHLPLSDAGSDSSSSLNAGDTADVGDGPEDKDKDKDTDMVVEEEVNVGDRSAAPLGLQRQDSISCTLPDIYSVYMTDDDVPYYQNHATGAVSWDAPHHEAAGEAAGAEQEMVTGDKELAE